MADTPRPTPRMPRWIVVACLVLLVGGFALWQLSPTRSTAPEFHLTSTGFENGVQGNATAFALSDYHGQVVVLDMMAVTCTSCRVVTRDALVPLHAEFGNRTDFSLVSIDTWADPAAGNLGSETLDELVALQKREGIPWRHALDTDQVYRKYSATALPRVVVVDGEGSIIHVDDGLVDAKALRRAVSDGLAGKAVPVAMPVLGLAALAAAAGLTSFFAPCSVGLVPAYLGLLLRADENRTPAWRAGLVTAGGAVAAYAALAIVLASATAAGFDDNVRARLPEVELTMGFLLVVLGALMLAKRDWSRLAARFGSGRIDGRKGFAAFGFAFSLASFACTGPVFLPILFAGMGDGVAGIVLAFGAYAASLAALLVGASLLVSRGHTAATAWFVRHAGSVSRAGALAVMGGGAYLLWFYATNL